MRAPKYQFIDLIIADGLRLDLRAWNIPFKELLNTT